MILFIVTICILSIAAIVLIASNIKDISQIKNKTEQTSENNKNETEETIGKVNPVPIYDKLTFDLSNYNVLESNIGNNDVAFIIKEEIRTTLGTKYKKDLNLFIDESSIVKTEDSIKMLLLNDSDKTKLCTVTVPTDDFGEVIVEE